MNNTTVRQIEMLKQVKDFGIAHASSFADGSRGKELFDSVAGLVTELEATGASQISERSAAHNLTSVKTSVRQELRDLLSAIRRTARAMAIEMPEFEGKFQVPKNVNDQTLLNAARAFLLDATPHKDNFIKRELPPDFLDRLSQLIASLDHAISQKAAAVGSHVAARLTIDGDIDRGLDLVQELNAIVRNKFHGDLVTLAAWKRASHVSKRSHNNGAEKAPNDPIKPPEPEPET